MDDIEFQLQVAQERNKNIDAVRTHLENEDIKGYELKDGLVYKNDPTEELALYVPCDMEDNII